MKLVAAKCPSCGAQIEVDKNSDSTLCEYCNSKIIVEDAIEKYKVEISGSIEIENLPKLENFLKLADRNYGEKDYAEAMNYYSKVVELDPDNSHALIRKGICKALESGYERFELDAMVNGFKYAYDGIKNNNEELNSYVDECFEVVKIYDKLLVDRYKQRNLSLSEINPFNDKIKKCVNAYKYLNQIVMNEPLKIEILKCLIQAMSNLIINKEYRTVVNGRSVIMSCYWNKAIKSALEEEKRKYIHELNMILGPDQNFERTESNHKEYFLNIIPMSDASMQAIRYICVAICGVMAIESLIYLNFVALMMFVATGVLTLPQISNAMVKGKKNSFKSIIICLKIFLFIVGCIFYVYASKI